MPLFEGAAISPSPLFNTRLSHRLLNGFRYDSPMHKEMLAILAALTAVIKERGGTDTSTEYFLALMESFDAIAERGDSETIAAVHLLSMGIKSVPAAVLRDRFSVTAVRLLDVMKRYMDDAEHINTLRALLSCMAALLRALPHSDWLTANAATYTYFDAMLAFVTHSKPKIRKSAQHAVATVLHGSCFMTARKPNADENGDDEWAPQPPTAPTIAHHPAGARLVRFCLAQFTADNIANAHTIVLHTLGLLGDTLRSCRTADIQTIAERLLAIMTAANVLIRTSCFHVLHTLFAARSRNVSAELTGRLITALYEYRPEKSDARQTLAWLTVLKEAHVCLSASDMSMTVRSVPALVEVCAGDLWMSERKEVVDGASNALRELFLECVQPVCRTEMLAEAHAEPIGRCIDAVAGGLKAPFGHVAKQVVLTFATVFEVCGKRFGKRLIDPLRTIAARYDAKSESRLQIEHTVLAAIPAMGVECVLRAVPLTKRDGVELELERSWMLPLLREAIAESTLEYFAKNIVPLADHCQAEWKRCLAVNDSPMAFTHELLWNQLWGLFPGFCRRPLDMYNFGKLARKLGDQLENNAELRLPVLDGLLELIESTDAQGHQFMGKYAHNLVPMMFNIYMTKGTESTIREKTLRTIGAYVRIAPEERVAEMYRMAQQQQEAVGAKGTFQSQALYDIVGILALYQSADELKRELDTFVGPVLRKQKKAPGVSGSVETIKKQQRKAYVWLENVLSSEREACVLFVRQNLELVQDIVLSALKTTCNTTQVSRLK